MLFLPFFTFFQYAFAKTSIFLFLNFARRCQEHGAHQYVCLRIFCFGNWIFVNRAFIVLCVLSILPITIYVFFHFRVRAIWVHLFSENPCLLSCGTLSVVNSPCVLLTWAEISVLDCHQVNCGSAWKKSTNSPLREITAFTSLSRILTTTPIRRFMLILR